MHRRILVAFALTVSTACASPPADTDASSAEVGAVAEAERSEAVVDPPPAVPAEVRGEDEAQPEEPVAVPPEPSMEPAPSMEPKPVQPEPDPPAAAAPVSPSPTPAPASKPEIDTPKPDPSPPAAPAAPAAEDGAEVPSARAAFEARQRRVLALAEADAGDGALQAEVDRLLDYRWLAESSLGGATRYAERCGARCDAFESALTELIRLHYLKRVRDSERGTVSYDGEETRQGGTVAKVDTTVHISGGRGQTLEIDYVLHRKGAGWKVRDMYTDGVGLATTYRREFAKMLEEGGIDLVIERLEAKVAELKRSA